MATRPVIAKTTDTVSLDTGILAGITFNKNTETATGQDTQSTKTAGLAKAMSNFYKILFTEKGSNPLNIQEGTSLSDLYLSNINDIQTLAMEVSSAVTDAFAQFSSIQDFNKVTAQEKLVGVVITDLRTTVPATGATAGSNTLDFSLLFSNAAGSTSPVQTPSIVLS